MGVIHTDMIELLLRFLAYMWDLVYSIIVNVRNKWNEPTPLEQFKQHATVAEEMGKRAQEQHDYLITAMRMVNNELIRDNQEPKTVYWRDIIIEDKKDET